MTTATVEKPRMNLQSIEQAINDLFDVSENLYDDDAKELYGDQLQAAREHVERELASLSDMEADKIDATVFVLLKKQGEANFYKQYEHMMANRRRTIENEIQHIKDNLQFILTQKELKKIKGNRHSISLRPSTAVVVDCDPKDLPGDYVKIETTYKPLKKELKDALKAGEEIGGVHIEERTSIQYR